MEFISTHNHMTVQGGPKKLHIELMAMIYRFKKTFTDRLSNKLSLIRLLTSPPHLKCVATLPCTLSLIACFIVLMFHKAVWLHMQGVVEPIITIILHIY